MSNPDADAKQTSQNQYCTFLRSLDPTAKWFTVQTFTDRELKPKPDPLAKVLNVTALPGRCSISMRKVPACGSPSTIPMVTAARLMR